MKIVIDVPEQLIKTLKETGLDWLGAEHALNAISDGQRLSEVIDKISAEIDGLHQKSVGFENEYEGGYNHAVDSVLDIIEKYKGG